MPLHERFWGRVDRSGGRYACWPWTGPLTDEGYGRLDVGDRTVLAHRVAYAMENGEVPPGVGIKHTCHDPAVCGEGNGCPHRACCNPRHLAEKPPSRGKTRA